MYHVKLNLVFYITLVIKYNIILKENGFNKTTMSIQEERRKQQEFVQLFLQRDYINKVNVHSDETEEQIWTDDDGLSWYMRKFVFRASPDAFATLTIYLIHDNETYLKQFLVEEKITSEDYEKCLFSKACLIYHYENPKYQNLLESGDIVEGRYIFRNIYIREAIAEVVLLPYVFK
jgi:hypothetical protein